MSDPITVVGSLASNQNLTTRLLIFNSLPIAYGSFEEGVNAAVEHYRVNFASGVAPQYRVYRSEGENGATHGLVEILVGAGDFVNSGFYKIVAGKYALVPKPGE